jgi:hypothetical protein
MHKFHSNWSYFLFFGVYQTIFIRNSKLEIETWDLVSFQKKRQSIFLKEILSIQMHEGRFCKKVRISCQQNHTINLLGLSYHRALAIKSALSFFL